MVRVLATTQIIPGTLERVWDFFSDPRNLSQITPPQLDFTVLTELPNRIYPGMMIEYRVRPLFGIAATWLTEITHVEPGSFFVDEQRIGPYRIWHHEHHFTALENGKVEVRDRVTYALPLGWLGELAHPLVKPQLERIFAYREKAVGELFR